jgi:hemolysin III
MAAVCASSPLAAASPPDSPSSCAACTKLQQEQHAQQQQQPHRSGGVGAAAGAALAVVKPRFRGVMHSYACAAMLSAGALLVFEAPTAVARWCALVYVAAAAAQFFISSLYHTGHWSPAATSLLKKLDHSCIYV